MAEGNWSATVAAAVQLADLLTTAQQAGQTVGESCEQAVDLMVFLGIRPLTARGRAAFSAFEDANASLTRTTHLWEKAVAAAYAVDPDAGVGAAGTAGQGTERAGGGVVLLPGTVGDRVMASDRSAGPGPLGAGGGAVAGEGAGAGGVSDAEADAAVGRIVLPFGWESTGQKLAEGLQGTSTPIEGRGRAWGLTAVDLYRDAHGAGAVLVHYDRDSTVGYDPVNDPYWGRLVGPDGELLEGRVLPSLRDELGRPEGSYAPTRAEKGRARAAGFVTGTVEQAATGWAPGIVGTAVGQVLGPAKDRATRKLAGRANDPTAPRKLVFSRRFDRMNLTQLELVRADFPRPAREDARHAQYVELERQAHHLGASEQRLEQARTAVARLPGFPRPEDHGFKRKDCVRAAQMHHREGRRLLAMKLLMDERRDEG
jgi:hypothetical protein